MNDDTGLKLYARNHILDNASRVAMECLTRIEATAERLLDGANPKKDASSEIKDILFNATKARAFLTEASK